MKIIWVLIHTIWTIVSISFSFTVSYLINKNKYKSRIENFDLEKHNTISKISTNFDQLLVRSETSHAIDLFGINKEQFESFGKISSLRSQIEINVFATKVFKKDRTQFENTTSEIYGRPVTLLNSFFQVIPEDDESEFYWPILFEFYPNYFPFSLVGFNLYDLSVKRTIDEISVNGNVSVTDPILFLDTQELGLLIIEPDINRTSCLVRGVRPDVLFGGEPGIIESMSISNDGLTYNLFYGNITRDDCSIINKTSSSFSICFFKRRKKTDPQAILVLIFGFIISILVSFILYFLNMTFKTIELSSIHSEFISNVSHEIKTPLNGISGMIDLLYTENDQLDYIDTIKNCKNSLIGMLDNVLYITELQKLCVIDKKIIGISSLVCKSINSVLCNVNDVNSIIKVIIKESTLKYIISDDEKISRIVSNLVSNSIKFTKNRPNKNISVNVWSEKKTMCIEVSDFGIGIPKKRMKEIFNKFSYGHQTETDYGGVGLGLNICKKLSKKLHGSISCKSEEGVGTSFLFKLCDVKEVNGYVHDKDEIHILCKTDNRIDFEIPNNFKVLIVDDNNINRKILNHMLRNRGISSESCVNGEEAFKLCSTHNFSIILMDIFMPILDGIDATDKIRKDGINKDTPIIFISATTDPKLAKRAITVGGNDFINKPVVEEVLLDKLNLYLKMYR